MILYVTVATHGHSASVLIVENYVTTDHQIRSLPSCQQ
jgi:hypothetical protein